LKINNKDGELMSRGISIYYKLLSKDNEKVIYGYSGADLNKKYVLEGIARFVCPPLKYSSCFGRNLMFGFVVKAIDIIDNCSKIDNIQQLELKNYILEGLKRINSEPDYYLYLSKYKTVEANPLELHHVFFDFSSIIKAS
jgi:hypothetical protein